MRMMRLNGRAVDNAAAPALDGSIEEAALQLKL